MQTNPREQALTWWRNLTEIDKGKVFLDSEAAKKGWTIQMFAKSSREIEKEWRKQNG